MNEARLNEVLKFLTENLTKNIKECQSELYEVINRFVELLHRTDQSVDMSSNVGEVDLMLQAIELKSGGIDTFTTMLVEKLIIPQYNEIKMARSKIKNRSSFVDETFRDLTNLIMIDWNRVRKDNNYKSNELIAELEKLVNRKLTESI